ncbi:MAG: Uma2 family endonuclease [Candidatus Vecturithrix sp.]|nr:Uma2 family endonuclease [Candidatus Vecturithrix sp.]
MSTESARRDRWEKFYEDERGGVPEYWLIDPPVQRVEWYQAEGGQFYIIPVDAENRYHSQVLPGFWLNVDWLWQVPLPHPVEALGAIAGIAPQEIARFLGRLKG